MAPANEAGKTVDPASVEVIYPNLKRRLSGVTTSMARLVPVLRSIGVAVAAVGFGLPDDIARLRLRDLPRLWRRPAQRPRRVWHARRNVEMLAGILLRHVARMPLCLIFTSASQRQHKPTTRWMIRRMDTVIATSAKSMAFLQVPATIVTHGIDLETYRPPDDQMMTKQSIGLDPNLHYVGCFGRIRHQKGTDLFVDALIPILIAHANWCGVIAGRVTERERAFANTLQQRIDEAGLSDRLRFVGERPDIKPWFQALDLFVAPARWEGFGLTPLEAMAMGVPVVTTDVGAFAELIVEGTTGTIVREQTPTAVASAIRAFVEDAHLREEAGRAARRHVEQHFTLEQEARSLAAVYDRFAPRKA